MPKAWDQHQLHLLLLLQHSVAEVGLAAHCLCAASAIGSQMPLNKPVSSCLGRRTGQHTGWSAYLQCACIALAHVLASIAIPEVMSGPIMLQSNEV